MKKKRTDSKRRNANTLRECTGKCKNGTNDGEEHGRDHLEPAARVEARLREVAVGVLEPELAEQRVDVAVVVPLALDAGLEGPLGARGPAAQRARCGVLEAPLTL